MDVFQFKQFSIQHQRSGIKVGTDGVLLGAWANSAKHKRILDIGTGCGLIAIMLAQRFEDAHITGIDINTEAITEARENAANCPWSARIEMLTQDILEYKGDPFDLICCNPPFFQDSTPAQGEARNVARHQGSLTIDTMVAKSKSLLSEEGKLCLILPADLPNPEGLHIRKTTWVKPTPDKTPKRKLLEMQLKPVDHPVEDELVVELARHVYSEPYIQLTSAFYLHM